VRLNRQAALVALATVAAALLLAPALPNGDGLGYLKAAADPAAGPYPGHLGYLALLRALRTVTAAGPRPADLLLAARLLSALCGALAVYALAATARLLHPPASASSASWVAGGGMAASFGLLVSASDVESYAPALAALCVALWALARRRAGGGRGALAAAAIATVAAALFHVENVLFALPALLLLRGRDRWVFALACALGLSATYGAAVASHGTGWLLGASHGFHYPLRAAAPAIALYGASKALVYSPYLYEASWPRVLAHFACGALALAALLVIARRARPLGRAVALAWLIPYGLLGLAFFPSDAERWIFLLPLLWLSVACAGRARAALLVVTLMFAANLVGWLPVARDRTARERAAAASRVTHAGDLVIFPGHGWDEYLGFLDGPAVEPYPLVFHAARLGGRAPLCADLAAAIARARSAGHAVLLARLRVGPCAERTVGCDDPSPLGWKELRAFDVTPANVAELLPGTRVRLSDDLDRLDP